MPSESPVMRQSITRTRTLPTEELLSFIAEIVARSPDKSCFASTSFLAQSIGRRKADVNAAKWELINSGKIELSLRANGNRRNLRHRLTLPTTPVTPARTPPPSDAMSRVPTSLTFPLMGLTLWGEMPRLDLIDCYLRSNMNVVPILPGTKQPAFSQAQWSKLSKSEKLDYFYTHPEQGVGAWLSPGRVVWDYDSDRQPENTLVSRRGEHSHNHFTDPSGEIYSTAKAIAPDIDTKANGSLIILPPTIHPTGMPYRWEVLRNPEPVPAKLMEMWRGRSTLTAFSLSDLPRVIYEGERDNTIWCFGRRLRAAGATFIELDRQLRLLNSEHCQPSFSNREIAYKISHVWKHRNRPKWSLH